MYLYRKTVLVVNLIIQKKAGILLISRIRQPFFDVVGISSDVYSGLFQTSEMELFMKIVHGCYFRKKFYLTCFTGFSILDRPVIIVKI